MKKIFTMFLLILSLGTYSYAEQHPDLTFKDNNGNTIEAKGAEQGLDIPSMKGKVVFLEFFGHRCPPCLISIPHLVELQKKYKDKLVIVSVEVQGLDNKELKKFAAKHDINYITATEKNARQLVNYIAARAEWSGSIPFMVAMDTKGDVQFVQAGMIPQDYLEGLVKDLSK